MEYSFDSDYPTMMDHSPDDSQPRRIMKGDWEQHKPLIKRLYVDEGKTLPDVIAIMKKNGYTASPKMFKDRIRKWGFEKKNKEHEMLKILHEIQGRKAIGKKSLIEVRGKIKTVEDVEHYFKRKKKLSKSANSTISKPVTFHCWTPSPVNTPKPPEEDGSMMSIECESNQIMPQAQPQPQYPLVWMPVDDYLYHQMISVGNRSSSLPSVQNHESNESWTFSRSPTLPNLMEEDTLVTSTEDESLQMNSDHASPSAEANGTVNTRIVTLTRKSTPTRSSYDSSNNFQYASNYTYGILSNHQRVPQSPIPPQTFLVPERIFFSIKKYMQGSFENKFWTRCGSDCCWVSNISAAKGQGDDSGTMWDYLVSAISMKNSGNYNEFRRLTSKAFNLVKHLLQYQPLRALGRLLDVLFSLIQGGSLDLACMLLEYIKNMATHMLGGKSAWADIFQNLCMVQKDSLQQAVLRSWKCTNESIMKQTGSFDSMAVIVQTEFIWRVYGSEDPPEAERLLRGLLVKFEQVPGALYERVAISGKLGLCMLKQCRYSETEKLGVDILSQMRASKNLQDLDQNVLILELIAWSQYFQDKEKLAEKNLREAIELIVQVWGENDSWVISDINRLQRWLREWGREEEADEMKAKVSELIGLDETDLEMAQMGYT